MGIKVFWPCKYLSVNDEEVVMARDQCQVIMDGVNNFSKKRVSCKDDSLVKNSLAENIYDVENMGSRVEDLCNEKLCGEMIYIFEDGVERSIEESRCNYMSKEGNEKNIAKNDKKVGSKENFERNKEDYNQGNACMNDDVVHGHGVKGRNSYILGRHWFEWRGAECDLVDDVGVFLTKVVWLHATHMK